MKLVRLRVEPMSVLLVVTKTPYEVFDCSVDFSAVIGHPMTITSVTSVNATDRADSSSQIVAASPAPFVAGNAVVFRVQGGTGRQTHNVSVKVLDDTTGSKFERIIRFQITD